MDSGEKEARVFAASGAAGLACASPAGSGTTGAGDRAAQCGPVPPLGSCAGDPAPFLRPNRGRRVWRTPLWLSDATKGRTSLAKLEAIHVRHVDVRQHQPDLLLAQCVNPFDAFACLINFAEWNLSLLQQALQNLSNRCRVIHNKNLQHAWHCLSCCSLSVRGQVLQLFVKVAEVVLQTP